MEPTNTVLIVGTIVYALFTLGMTEFFRRHLKLGAIFFLLAPLTFPLWFEHRAGWFQWAKIMSVLLPTALLGLNRWACFENREGRVWNVLKSRKFLWFFFAILALNITEASLRDWQLGNYFNALSGFILILTIPFADKYWRMDRVERGDLVVDFTRAWCLLYTTWNACFLYASLPNEFAMGLAILIAAEFYPFIGRPDLYVMARVYTLALFVLQLGCFGLPTFMDSTAWYSADFARYWGILNLVGHVAYVVWYNWQIHSDRAAVSFRHPRTCPEAQLGA